MGGTYVTHASPNKLISQDSTSFGAHLTYEVVAGNHIPFLGMQLGS